MSDEYRYPNSVASLPVVPEPRDAPAPKSSMSESSANPKQVQTADAAETAVRADPPPPTEQDPTRFVHQKLIEGKVIEALQKVYDPEIPVNIYELGLIYDIAVNPDDTVHIKMTLTAPACPVAGSLPGEVERQVESVPEVKSATVELVWDPPWSRDRMSEAAQLQLGML